MRTRYLQYQPRARHARCYFFNTFFFTKLSEKAPAKRGRQAGSGASEGGQQPLPKERAGHARVVKWVKVGAWVLVAGVR